MIFIKLVELYRSAPSNFITFLLLQKVPMCLFKFEEFFFVCVCAYFFQVTMFLQEICSYYLNNNDIQD